MLFLLLSIIDSCITHDVSLSHPPLTTHPSPLTHIQGAVEIDQRSIAFLKQKLPALEVTHQDVLQTSWSTLATQRGGPLNLIGNLPYYITSQILFTLADSYKAVKLGVFTTQLEVSE